MATHLEHGTLCAVCRRNLLVGESARTYQDARNKSVLTVCPLCVGKADRAGWQLLGERSARRPLPVNVDNEVDHERLVVRLQSDLERLEHDLGGSQIELRDERATREQLEAELAGLRGSLAEALQVAATVDARLADKDRLIADADRRAAESLEAQEMLLRARRREADPTYMCGIAAEIFNRSPHMRTVLGLIEEHGSPSIRLGVEGCTLPRAIRVTFAWPGGSCSYRVTCDLVARLFDVEDLARGTGLQAPLPSFRSNARLDDGRLVVHA
ncbi:MAG: hypothetical protein QOE98_2564 [Gaiellaceae bacterium]|nr:hypothetical protein [Gaiellaceae bacterium]